MGYPGGQGFKSRAPVLLCVVLGLTLGIACDGDKVASPTVQSSATSTVTPTATPAGTTGQATSPAATATPVTNDTPNASLATIAGVTVRPLTIGADVPMPEAALYLNITCYACEGGTNPHRAYATQGLAARVEVWPPAGPIRDGGRVLYSADGVTAFTDVCEKGNCRAGIGPANPGSVARAYRSQDGGATFKAEGLLPPNTGFAAVAGDEAIAITWNGKTGTDEAYRVSRFPSDETIVPPPDLTRPFIEFIPRIGLLWRTIDGTDPKNPINRWFTLPGRAVFGLTEPGLHLSLQATGQRGEGYLTAYQTDGVVRTTYLLVINPDRTVTDVFSFGGYDLRVSGELRTRVLIGNALIQTPENPSGFSGEGADFGPVVIDLNARTVSRIGPLKRANLGSGHAFIELVVPGQFGAVRGVGAGDCLNVRNAPSTSAPVLACYAEGVLIPFRTPLRPTNGFQAVMTLDGRPGWASLQFLDR